MSETRYAVLIGSSSYPKDPKLLEPLRCPHKDVDGLCEILVSPSYGRFSKPRVLKDQPHNEILRELNQILNQADTGDLVLIYYSGHGKLNRAGRLHLATVDTEVNLLDTTSISVERIRELIDLSSVKRVVLILDCCYSGRVGHAFLKSGVDDQLQRVQSGQGIYILTASTGIQVAQEKEGDSYSHFTKQIIEGIREGRADTNGDGFVSINDLYRYAAGQMSNESLQVPMRWDLNIQGNEFLIARTGEAWKERQCQLIQSTLLKKGFGEWTEIQKGYLRELADWVSAEEIAELFIEVKKDMKARIAKFDRESQIAIDNEDWIPAIGMLQEWLSLEPSNQQARARLTRAKEQIHPPKATSLSWVKSILQSHHSRYISLAAGVLIFILLWAVYMFSQLVGALLAYAIFGAFISFRWPHKTGRLTFWLSTPIIFLFGFIVGFSLLFSGYYKVLITLDIPLLVTGLFLVYGGVYVGEWLARQRKSESSHK